MKTAYNPLREPLVSRRTTQPGATLPSRGHRSLPRRPWPPLGLLNYGLLHEDLFFETNGEFFGVWERVKPIVGEARERFVNQQFIAHLERAAQRYEAWAERRSPGHVAAMRQFMKQMSAQLAAGARA